MKKLLAAFLLITFEVNAQLNTDSLKYYEKFKQSDMYTETKSPQAQKNYEEALKLFNESRFVESISFYKKALEIDTNFIDAMDNLGNSYRYNGNLDSAEFWYKKSIKMYPSGYIAHQNLAIVYTSTSRQKLALNEYDLMIKMDPQNPEGYFGKSNFYVALNNGDEVVSNAQKAIELYHKSNDPYEMDAVFILGIGYYMKGNKSEAKKYLLQAQTMGKDIPVELQDLIK